MRFEVKVVNLNTCKEPLFPCDRTTCLGNPYVMKRVGGTARDRERDRVCDAFAATWKPNREQLAYLREIWRAGVRDGIVRIGCHCAPSRCHLFTVKAWLESHMT